MSERFIEVQKTAFAVLTLSNLVKNSTAPKEVFFDYLENLIADNPALKEVLEVPENCSKEDFYDVFYSCLFSALLGIYTGTLSRSSNNIYSVELDTDSVFDSVEEEFQIYTSGFKKLAEVGVNSRSMEESKYIVSELLFLVSSMTVEKRKELLLLLCLQTLALKESISELLGESLEETLQKEGLYIASL